MCLLLMAVAAWAVPARPIVEDLLLEDGSVVRGAVFCGDEFGHYWETADGRRFVEAQGAVRMVQGSRFKVQGAQENAQRRTPGVKNLAARGLVILADFKDVHFRQQNTLAEMDSMLNGRTYAYHKSYASAKQYFHDQSFGQYNPVFDVVGPVQLPDSLKYYGRNLSGSSTDAKGADMVLKACSIASGMEGVDLSLYDENNDGMLDFVFVIYAGYGESDSRIDSLVWPASWTMGSAVRSGYTSLPSNSPVSAYTFQGKTISYYAYSSELNYYNTIYRPTPGYSDSVPLRAGIGVFCHEFGHVLGLPDYYDTRSGTNYKKCLTPGNWDIMDVGTYNADGYVPPMYSPHERWWLGWAAPTLLNDTAHVTLPADNQTAYYVTRDGGTALATTADTVFYLENRQLTGWDQGLPGHGMMIWRVVYNASIWSSNTPNNTAEQPRYFYMAADSTYTYSGATGLQGDDGDPFPGSTNVTEYSLFGGRYPILNIEETNGLIEFDFMGVLPDTGGTAAVSVVESEGRVTDVYSLTGVRMGSRLESLPAGVYILRKDNGDTEKIWIR